MQHVERSWRKGGSLYQQQRQNLGDLIPSDSRDFDCSLVPASVPSSCLKEVHSDENLQGLLSTSSKIHFPSYVKHDFRWNSRWDYLDMYL